MMLRQWLQLTPITYLSLLANNLSTLYSALALHLQQQQQQQQQHQQQSLGQLATPDLTSYFSKLPMNLFQSQLSKTPNQFNLLQQQHANLKQLIFLNEQQIQKNLKNQEDLKTKLFFLNTTNHTSSTNNLIEQIQYQLNELIQKHADLINEQMKLKNQDVLLNDELSGDSSIMSKQALQQKQQPPVTNNNNNNIVNQDECNDTDDNEEENNENDQD